MAHKIICIAGARPNFVKIAPITRALAAHRSFDVRLVHTGQHYDEKLSRVFFDELRIPRPDIELEVGSGSHAAQTAEIMRRFEPVLTKEQPEAVLVVGDVNSTAACAMVTAKFHLDHAFTSSFGRARTRPVMIHVEAGLRSFDDDMPEEINRRVTDTLSDLLFVTEPSGVDNLQREGIAESRVSFVGNVMIDTLLHARERATSSKILDEMQLGTRPYGLVTLHRPSNVDDPAQLSALIGVLDDIAQKVHLVFPVHPRTRARLDAMGLKLDPSRWTVSAPVGYIDFLRLMSGASVVLTDSGGIQEETTVLGVRCLTLRDNTERPVTIDEGTNVLAGTRRETVLPAFERVMQLEPHGRIPKYWDGRAAERIRDVLVERFEATEGT